MALRCDRMDGLVVKSAEEALEMENIIMYFPLLGKI
jgi:hypothetical protein